ncbi:MAG: TrkH family potassium uptake protein [Dehalococcoidia bacterium]|nr:MAG: TrkH family potassium uptake protein [Dehalococcoidia bacterium]
MSWLGLVIIVPLIILPYYRLEIYLAKYFIVAAVITASLGMGLQYFFKGNENEKDLKPDDAFIVITLVWSLAIGFSALPFILSGFMGPIDALYESTSGWTTTGLSMMTASQAPYLFLFWRSIMQFIGGAGIAVIFLSSMVGITGSMVYQAEARSDRIVPNIKYTARIILKLYGGFFILGTVLYLVCGMGLFDAVNHAMCTLSTGGFSTKDASIGYWNSFSVEAVTIFLMLAGSINFSNHYHLFTLKIKEAVNDIELKSMAIFIVCFVPLVMAGLMKNVFTNLLPSLRHGIFGIISSMTTAGFATLSFQTWSALAIFSLTLMMIVGGSTGSTAGGAKLLRIAASVKSIYWYLREKVSPEQAIFQNVVIRRNKRIYLKEKDIVELFSFIMLYVLTYSLGVLIFVAYGFPILESMFEFASSLSTVGVSIGLTQPTMPATCKIVQMAAMLLGRLEFLAIIYAGVRFYKDVQIVRN